MIWSVVCEGEIFASNSAFAAKSGGARSSNPYDYLRCGYFLDNASLFGGKNFVDFNSDISSNRPGVDLYFSAVGKRPFGDIS